MRSATRVMQQRTRLQRLGERVVAATVNLFAAGPRPPRTLVEVSVGQRAFAAAPSFLSVARIRIRVGRWSVGGAAWAAGLDERGAINEARAHLRATLVARRAWHETAARACEVALRVLDGEAGS